MATDPKPEQLLLVEIGHGGGGDARGHRISDSLSRGSKVRGSSQFSDNTLLSTSHARACVSFYPTPYSHMICIIPWHLYFFQQPGGGNDDGIRGQGQDTICRSTAGSEIRHLILIIWSYIVCFLLY